MNRRDGPGGIYVPPYRLKEDATLLRVAESEDKSSEAYQRLTWEALKKSLNGLINKVNASNIKNIIVELFAENLIRGRALFVRSLLKAQSASLPFTAVFSAMLAVLNSKLPILGELTIKKLILQFRRSYKRNDKTLCLATVSFLAHLINQQVVHELLALELLTLLLERPTDDSVEIAVGFLKDCGATLTELSPKGMDAVFERFRVLLVDSQETQLDQRVQWMIQVLFQIRKDKFKDHPAVKEELDLVDESDRITHTISILSDDLTNMDEGLTIFKFDPNFVEHEKTYAEIKEEIIGDVDLDALAQEAAVEAEETEEAQPEENQIQDRTGADLVQLRKTIYLTIMSSLEFEECCHKLLKMKVPEAFELEICNMIAECCSQERIYNKFFGLLAQRLCQVNPAWALYFEQSFAEIYNSIHRFETNRIRNLSKLFSFLMTSFSVSWPNILRVIRLTEAETTSASRVLIKFLFTDIAQEMGIKKLNETLSPVEEPSLEWQEGISGIFPTDNARDMRFAINFFTAIDLGPLTDRLREIYNQMQSAPQQAHPKQIANAAHEAGYSSDDLNLSDVSLSDDESYHPRKR